MIAKIDLLHFTPNLVIIMATKTYGTPKSGLIDTRMEVQYTEYSLVTELG